ncbi:MAG: HAMP domain-containing sensor histidine kinase [Eubacteriales bacterium]|nr:HAMP domain-containing sensor histidine kinase [Eubacteriales bacterium]
MDTKSKNIDKNKIMTAVAFILCVVLFIAAVGGGFFTLQATFEGVDRYENVDELLFCDSYQESVSFQREFQEKLNDIQYLLSQYGSEEIIRSGKTISAERLEYAIRDLFYAGSYEGAPRGDGAPRHVTIDQNAAETYGNDYDVPSVRERFKEDHGPEIEEIKEVMIMEDLQTFQNHKDRLDREEGFSYYASDGVNTVTNLTMSTDSAISRKQFSSAPAYFIYEDGALKKVPASQEISDRGMKYFDQGLEDLLDSERNEAFKVYFSFDKQYLAGKEISYAAARSQILKLIPLTIVCALLSLVSLIYLIVTAGRKDEEGNRPVYAIDRLFTELQLLIVGFLFIGGGLGFGSLIFNAFQYGIYYDGSMYARGSASGILWGVLGVAVGLGVAAAGLAFILSVVRNIKAGRFFKNSLICVVVSVFWQGVVLALWQGLKAFYLGGSLMKKVVLITLAICILSATVFLAPVVAIIIIVLAPKWVKKYEDIKKGVEEVKNGNLTYKIPLSGDGELDELAKGINEISEASNLAIQNELKNQRLKTDLISNVSHDLKTPLTSIITYIDLLKQKGLDSADAPKYLEILDQKSIRLKKLTEDLFDAAKASSGAIPVRFEKVEMLSLINQGLGELNNQIETTNLNFIINAQKNKYYVKADGQLIWRVVENLLSNVLKYAQEGSRVYIDLKEQNGRQGKTPTVILEIKNVSKSELNIDADELMERFKRGDESRTTEGSGLGLAIAKDLVRLQNGWFEIKIDGDLFKAIIMLEAYPEEKEER